MADVTIAGGGVAGSMLASILAGRGFRVKVYDIMRSYGKACGDALTIREGFDRIVEETGSYKGEVHSFTVMVNGLEAASIDFGHRVWFIIDKPKLVNGLREIAEANGAEIIHSRWSRGKAPVTVDARGPYAWNVDDGNSVFVLRYIVESKWDPRHALLDFRTRERGFYWIFPADPDGRLVNIGAGFEEYRKLDRVRILVNKYAGNMLGKYKILDERGAPISIKVPVTLWSGDVFRVGEAAGLVISTAGEGNRPALESASALARALTDGWPDKGRVRRLYKKGVSRLVSSVKLSRTLLSIVEDSDPQWGAKILSGLPKSFWAKYFTSTLMPKDLIPLALKRPGLGAIAVRSLLSSLF